MKRPRSMTAPVLLAATLLLGCSAARGDSKAGGGLPASVQLKGTQLTLNGVGLRETDLFGVDVYIVGLYLVEKSKNAKEIIKSPEPKQLRFRFIRNVSSTDLRNACRKGFRGNGANLGEISPHIRKLNRILPSVRRDERVCITFYDDRVEITHQDQPRGSIDGEEFSEALLSLWLGRRPPSLALKNGLLGLR